jgi:DnaJ domain
MFIAALAVVLIAALWWVLTTASPATLSSTLRWAGGILLGLLALYLALTGRVALDIPLTILGFILVNRNALSQLGLFSWLKRPQGGASPKAGNTGIETPWLRMTLDRRSGALDGEVLTGTFAGAPLGRLSLDQLRTLLAECAAADEQSVRLLETYLDRTHPRWRDQAPPPARGRMSRAEALEILGLAEGAEPDEIRDAHRRLMMKLHPDHGGSDYLAQQINLARDLLLGG